MDSKGNKRYLQKLLIINKERYRCCIMDKIESLNLKYIETSNLKNTFDVCNQNVSAIQNKIEMASSDKVTDSINLLCKLLQEYNIKNYSLIYDVILLGKQYISCKNSILKLKNCSFNEKLNENNISEIINNIYNEQNKFEEIKNNFIKEHNISIDSADDINKVILLGIKNAISENLKYINNLKELAVQEIKNEYTISLSADDDIQDRSELPLEFIIAKYPIKNVNEQILKDIGVSNTYEKICMDLKNQGNIIINSNFESIDDVDIDEFVIAYIIKYIETFPLGTVNVHVFDQNANYLYKRLMNGFMTDDASENAKKIVQVHSKLNDLSYFKNNVCDDIFKKTSVEKPDLYSIFEYDNSDVFNLIVIRNGVIDGNGYVSAETLEILKSLTDTNDTGHKCGLRFLIVDYSESSKMNLTPNNTKLLEKIAQNCEIKLNYCNGKFLYDNKEVETLNISDDIDLFVQKRVQIISEILNAKEKSYISLSDISTYYTELSLGNTMYIPVGKSGGTIIDLPFSCKDESGVTAEQCVGYIAIGQSGSGKSSFFHSLVLNGCFKYSPKDLQFWLLDFKNGGASSKYSKSGIPHIKIIAENNKVDDALCLFQMILEEMDRRSKAFNLKITDNITDYNKIATRENLEYFPRIIIAIDEVQEIFREDSASVLQKLISSISTRMRSFGIHFVMVAQNLCDGKSYMLKDAFLPSATGRICFRVSQNIPRDSGFEDEFVQRKQEISELKTGEAYVSYGKNTIKKVKMAYISTDDMLNKYFPEICKKYSEYNSMQPLVIGSKLRLTVTSLQQGTDKSYLDLIKSIKSINGCYYAIVGEDVYRMTAQYIRFSQSENSSALFLGSDKQISSSICASIALSLHFQDVCVYLFNGDRAKYQYNNDSILHPFMYVCQNITKANSFMKNYRLDELKNVIKDIYSEYLIRQDIVQKSYDDEPVFSAKFLIVNDLFGIESFNNNDMICNETVSDQSSIENRYTTETFDNEISIDEKNDPNMPVGSFREPIQSIMSILLKNGYRYNIHIILAIKGDPSIWRAYRILTEVNNVILFNDTEYADQTDNSYYLKEMLKNISNDGDETLAVWYRKKSFSKIRPIIYDMTNKSEKNSIDSIIGE